MPQKLNSLENPARQSSEEELVRRVQGGEHDLFYELIRPYERRLYSAAFSILRNESDAEDVARRRLS